MLGPRPDPPGTVALHVPVLGQADEWLRNWWWQRQLTCSVEESPEVVGAAVLWFLPQLAPFPQVCGLDMSVIRIRKVPGHRRAQLSGDSFMAALLRPEMCIAPPGDSGGGEGAASRLVVPEAFLS